MAQATTAKEDKPKSMALDELQNQIVLSLALNSRGDCRPAGRLQDALAFYRDGRACSPDSAMEGIKAVFAGLLSNKFRKQPKDAVGLRFGIYRMIDAYRKTYNGTGDHAATEKLERELCSFN